MTKNDTKRDCRFLLLLLLCMTGVTRTFAYSFSAVCPTGQTLYYTITDATNRFVQVVAPNGTSGWNSYTKPTGDLTIPAMVTYNNRTYSVTYIGVYAFYGCNGLTSVTIPNSVNSIYSYAFYNCSGLTEIVSLHRIPPMIYSNTFNNVSNSIPIYVPAESLSTYQNASYWSAFTNYIGINDAYFTSNSTGQTLYYELLDMVTHEVTVAYPSSSASAPWEGFEQPTGHVIIPETVIYQGITYTVRQIKDHAFYGCSGITQVTIGENITYVGPQAFWNCPNLETVNYNAINCDVMNTHTGSGTTPSPFVYYSVFSSDASGGAPALARVTIGNSVQRIPNYAFKDAENIYQRLVIPASVNEIGNYAFYNCNSMVQMVIQGEGLQTIGDYAFYGCSALQTAVNLPNSVITIGDYAFTGCTHVPSLTIGEGVTSIWQQAFWNCPLMVTVNFNAVNCTTMHTRTGSGTSSSPYVYYSVFNSGTTVGGTTPITTLNIGANVTNIPDYAFRNSPNAAHNLVLPEGLLNIGQYAFHSGGFMGDLIIPNTTQTIGQYAYYGCEDITALTIGEGATSIGGYAFWNCPSLATVNFNALNCTTMNTAGSYSVFNSGTSNGGITPITALTIGNNVTNIPDYAFYNSPSIDNELPLPNGLINIGQYAFYNCSSLTGSLLIPNTVSNIGQYAFYDCSSFDGTLTLSYSLGQIEQYTFHGCSGLNGTLVIPNSVLTIANNAFEDCSGFSGHLNLHNALSSLGGSAFYGCSNLSELTIGEGMTTIGGSAFWNCPTIQTVHFNATNCTSMNTNSQYSVFNSGTTDGGQTPIITLSIGENVTRIPDYAFRNSVNATSDIIIPNATTYIGTYAFFGFRSPLLTIGEGVSTIGHYAFWYCPLLQTVNYNAVNCTQMYTRTGAGTTASPYVYYSVFSSNINASGVPSILTLHIGKHVQIIPDYAFKGSSNISNKLLFPNVLTSIGVQSFYECSSIVGDLVLPNAVTSVGEYAFFDCHGFDGSLVIGSGISTINQYTFADCMGFTGALIIGRSVSSIGAYAFRNCSAFSNLISEFPTPPTAESTSFNNMTYTIPVHVPYAMIPAYQAATGWSSFTNYKEQFVFDQLSNDSWSDTQNWYAFELPTANDVVCVNSNCHMDMPAEVLHLYVLNLNDALTINSGQTLTTTYGIGTLQPSQLIITDGAQLVNPISNAYGTVQRNVNGYSAETDNWFVLGTPIYEGTETNTIATGTYDLFYYSEPTHYWMNEKMSENGFTMLEPAKGYLYANQAQQTIAFEGQINASNAEFSVPVTYEGSPLAGYTLVGNPYTNNLNIGDVKLNGTPLTTYYRISDSGGLVAYTAADPIHPGEGFLVMASAGGTLTFVPVHGRNHMVNMRETMGDEGPTRGFRVPNHGDLTNINAYSSETTYTIAATVNPAESGTVQGAGTYGDGTICTLIATAIEGFTFVNWTENGNQVSLETSYSFTVNGDRTLVANFVSNQPNSYIITATANPTEGGTVTGSGTYQQGQTCTLTATANAGYIFINWTDNGVIVSTDVSYTFTVSEDRNLIAEFYENSTYPLTYSYNEDDHTATLTGRVDGVELEGELVIPETVMHNGETYSVTSIGTDAFVDCNGITELTIPSSVTKIGHGAFFGCTGLTSINIPASVVSIINNPFQACVNLAQIIVESGNACYDSRDNCNAIIETSTNSLVSGCRNTIIPDNVASIGELAFYSQPITEITIPASVEYIGTYAFMFTALSSITLLPETPPTLGRSPFIYFPSNFPFQVPCGSLEAYQNADGWNEFTNFQEKWFNIQVSVNPDGSGSIIGEGDFCLGSTCTLTATANTGYHFVNWTENGEIVSTEPSYSFTVVCDRNLTANFETITNHWTPVPEGLYSQSTTIKGVILFNGVEQFSNQLELGIFCGDECRGSAIAAEFFITHRFIADVNVYGENGHQLSFRLYDHSLGTELNYTPPANVVFTEDGYGEWMDPLALNFTSLVEISATVDPEDAGVVTGEGNYAIGASCTLTAAANEGYQFAYWTLNDVEVSTNPTISFTVAEAASYVAHFHYVHSRSLVEGWNWWSTFIEQEGINGLEMLENSLGASGIRIQGKNASVDRIEYEGNVYWYGSLNSINNEQMYKIRTNSACSATVVGDAADLGDHHITINSGWNWIGFPSSQSLSVETAMSGFTPEANDVIKGRGGSTTYLSTGEYNLWYGTLTTLEPGQGYMYKSNSSSSKTLTFQSGRNGEAKAVEESGLFEPTVDNYANNMLITAVVEINDEELRSDDFELAAFVGNDCRGSVRLMYVEPLDRYVAFLLVFGDVEEPLHFVLTDGYDEYDSEELMTYVSDGLIGTLTEPATLHFGTLGINDDGGNGLVVFPNPSHDVFNIEGTDIRKIEVTDIYGQVILAKEMAGQHIQINLNGCAAGTYLLRILTNNEIVTSKLIQY